MHFLKLFLESSIVFILSNLLLWVFKFENTSLIADDKMKLIDLKNITKTFYIKKYPIMVIPEGLPEFYFMPVLTCIILIKVLAYLIKCLKRSEVFSKKNESTQISHELITNSNNISEYLNEETKFLMVMLDENCTTETKIKELILNQSLGENEVSLVERVNANEQSILELTQRITHAETLNLKLVKEIEELRQVVQNIEIERSQLDEKVSTEAVEASEHLEDSLKHLKHKEFAILNELQDLGQLISELRKKAESVGDAQEEGTTNTVENLTAGDIQTEGFGAEKITASGGPQSPLAPFYLSNLKLRNPTILGNKRNLHSKSHHRPK